MSASRLLASLPALVALSLAGCAGPDPPGIDNVIVVMVDTLRADHLEPYGYDRPTSPFLDSLAARAVLFEDASAPSSQTVPSVLSLWSGVYPRRHGNQYFPTTDSLRLEQPRATPFVPPDLPLMAEIFRDRGFATAAVITNPWLDPRGGFDRGFDQYRFMKETDPGSAVNSAAGELLDGLGVERFLLYLHYMDVHSPYEPPDRYVELFAGDLPGKLVYHNGRKRAVAPDDVAYSRALYDGGVRAMDDVLAELLADLEVRGLMQTTLLVIVGDHGEEFYEHKGLGHGHSLHGELVQVPLLLLHPSLPAGRVAVPVGLIDLLPTLLGLTGGEAPAESPGISLVPLIEETEAGQRMDHRTLFYELGTAKSARRGNHKIIRRSGKHESPARREQFFDLGLDPMELTPLADAEWARQLGVELDEFVADASHVSTDNEQPIAPGSDLEKRLKALGYLD